jgi:hypothetical protein
MNNLEKLIFIEITNLQQGRLENSVYYKTFELLTETEQNEYFELEAEIRAIWNNLNAPKNILTKKYNSFEDYQNDNNVSPKISSIMEDFNLTLKDELSEKSKMIIIKLMGKDFYDENF